MSMLQGNRSDSLKKDSATPSSPLDSPKPKARKTRVKKSSSSKKKDGQIADFQRQVREYHLEAFIDGLLALGVERAMDLKFVSDEDLDNLGMKPIQKKKLLSLMPAEEVSGSSVAGSKPVARKKKKKKKPAAGSASPPRESTSPNQTLAAAPSSPASPPPTSNPPPTPPSIAPQTPPSNAPPPAPQRFVVCSLLLALTNSFSVLLLLFLLATVTKSRSERLRTIRPCRCDAVSQTCRSRPRLRRVPCAGAR